MHLRVGISIHSCHLHPQPLHSTSFIYFCFAEEISQLLKRRRTSLTIQEQPCWHQGSRDQNRNLQEEIHPSEQGEWTQAATMVDLQQRHSQSEPALDKDIQVKGKKWNIPRQINQNNL